jgi:hypothetical protein
MLCATDPLIGVGRTVMTFLLVLAVVLFLLGLFTLKILWWAALVIAIVWLVGMLRGRRPALR